MREKAPRAPPRYDGRWHDRGTEAPRAFSAIPHQAPAPGEKPSCVISFRAMCASRTKDLDGFIILRSDGNPAYMHAVVVDDHDMGVHPHHPAAMTISPMRRQTIIAMPWAGRCRDVSRSFTVPMARKLSSATVRSAWKPTGQWDTCPGPAQLPCTPRLEPGDDEVMSIAG